MLFFEYLILFPIFSTQSDSERKSHDFCCKWRDPDRAASKNHRNTENGQGFYHNPSADCNDVCRFGSFGREQEGRIDKVQRHGDEGQAKQR